MAVRWPDAERVERARMERPQLYCPVCRRPALSTPGAGVIELSRRLASHLVESHDPYFLAQLRAALNLDLSDGPFYPTDDDA